MAEDRGWLAETLKQVTAKQERMRAAEEDGYMKYAPQTPVDCGYARYGRYCDKPRGHVERGDPVHTDDDVVLFDESNTHPRLGAEEAAARQCLVDYIPKHPIDPRCAKEGPNCDCKHVCKYDPSAWTPQFRYFIEGAEVSEEEGKRAWNNKQRVAKYAIQPFDPSAGTIAGVPIEVDPSMPTNEIELRSGRSSVRITNLTEREKAARDVEEIQRCHRMLTKAGILEHDAQNNYFNLDKRLMMLLEAYASQAAPLPDAEELQKVQMAIFKKANELNLVVRASDVDALALAALAALKKQ